MSLCVITQDEELDGFGNIAAAAAAAAPTSQATPAWPAVDAGGPHEELESEEEYLAALGQALPVPPLMVIPTCSFGSDCHLQSIVARGAFGTVHGAVFQGLPVMAKVLQALPGVTPDAMKQKLRQEVNLHVSCLDYAGSTA